MKYLTYQQLKRLWIKFFQSHQHQFVSAVNLVNPDQSLLWINSGIAGLKNYFLGINQPPSARLVNIQKAVRTNDIGLIGRTNRHLTLFEMLGSFAIADYFKESAIRWAIDFLTNPQWLDLPLKKLYFTVWKADPATLAILQNDLKISPTHILLKTKATNFWDLGVGPCGPNLEIFYDLGPEFDPQNQNINLLVNDIDNDRYLEIWNIVFSQFNNVGQNNYVALAHKNIDTGAGLERLLMIVQERCQLFATDLFVPFLNLLQQKTSQKFHDQTWSKLSKLDQIHNSAFAIIIDHLRAVVFMLTDLYAQQTSFNFQSRHGYIVRRLIRRAFVQMQVLQITSPFLAQMVALVVQMHVIDYPELKVYQTRVTKTILDEETKIHQLWQSTAFTKVLALADQTTLTGQQLFELVTTHGLPLDLIQMLAEQRNIILELPVFYQLFARHQKLSRGRSKAQDFVEQWSVLATTKRQKTKFLASSFYLEQAHVLAVFPTKQPQKYWIIFDQTPFYAEKGGQVADTGKAVFNGQETTVIDVQLNNFQQHLHLVVAPFQPEVGALASLAINRQQRLLTTKNHSATHLLHAILREKFGTEIQQTGSFNNHHYLRLDFTYSGKLTPTKLVGVEQRFKSLIAQKIQPTIRHTTLKEAQQQGALAFFKDRYQNPVVRIVQFGTFSQELCGGTHVRHTGLIEKFLITNYETISQNKHRIYALTDRQTIQQFLTGENTRFTKLIEQLQSFCTTDASLTNLLKEFVQTTHYLSKKTLFLKLAKLPKLLKHQAQLQKLQKFVANYTVPESALFEFNKQQFCFLQVSGIQFAQPLLLLRALYDRYFSKLAGTVLIFPNLQQSQHAFFIKLQNRQLVAHIANFLAVNYPDQIKFGHKHTSLQGVMLLPIPQLPIVLEKLRYQLR